MKFLSLAATEIAIKTYESPEGLREIGVDLWNGLPCDYLMDNLMKM